MNGFELLRLFVTLEVKGESDVSKALKRVEGQGAAAEEELSGVGEGFDKNAKKIEGAATRMVKALGGVEKKSKDLRKNSNVTLKAELEGSRQVTAGLDAIGDRQERLHGSRIQLKAALAGAREVISEFSEIEGAKTSIDGDEVTITADVKGGAEGGLSSSSSGPRPPRSMATSSR